MYQVQVLNEYDIRIKNYLLFHSTSSAILILILILILLIIRNNNLD